MVGVVIEELAIGADPRRWGDVGFAVKEDRATVGSVCLRFTAGEGVLGWQLDGNEEEIGRASCRERV